MRLEVSDLPFVLAEARRSPFVGAALLAAGELPRLNADSAAAVFADFGFSAPASVGLPDILRTLGFARVEEAADLGTRMAAPAHRTSGEFDTVFDFGVSMRTFHVRHALATLGHRVAVGGRVIHLVPSANHIDQGFYMASPRLFHDYYRANGWHIDKVLLTRRARGGRVVEGIPYAPGSLKEVAHGGLDDGMYRIFCVATRLPESTVGQIPQHGFYVKAWLEGDAHGEHSPLPSALGSWLRSTRWAYRVIHFLVAPRRKRRIRATCLTPSVRYHMRDVGD